MSLLAFPVLLKLNVSYETLKDLEGRSYGSATRMFDLCFPTIAGLSALLIKQMSQIGHVVSLIVGMSNL